MVSSIQRVVVMTKNFRLQDERRVWLIVVQRLGRRPVKGKDLNKSFRSSFPSGARWRCWRDHICGECHAAEVSKHPWENCVEVWHAVVLMPVKLAERDVSHFVSWSCPDKARLLKVIKARFDESDRQFFERVFPRESQSGWCGNLMRDDGLFVLRRRTGC